MNSCIRMGTVIAVALCLPGCATVTRGTSQKFAIESIPSGANVGLSTGQTCTTPCRLNLKRKRDFTAKFTKDGYQPREANVESKVRVGGGTALVGNLVVGGIVGLIVDMSNGSIKDLRPNPLNLTLAQKEGMPVDSAVTPTGQPPEIGAQPATSGQASRIAKGDKIKISTFGEDRFSGEFAVHGDGKITFPLFGDIPAAGLTAQQLVEAISKRLAPDYLRDPRVTAEIISFRPVYILGEVAKPGQYPYVEGMTMYALIAQAGGLSYRANRKYAYVRHDSESAELHIMVESSTPVMPGDTIRITQRIF